jgi:uncharacterized membrane protein SpoIIM required for sporulation
MLRPWLRAAMPGRAPVLLVAGAVAAGGVVGYSGPQGHCDLRHVTFLGIYLQNLGLCLALASGVFTLGITALVPGAIIMALTGVTVGAAMRSAGGQAILLMAPHGPFEILAWVLAMDIGLTSVSAHLTGLLRGQGAVTHPDGLPRTDLARKALMALVLVTVAAVVEVLWVHLYAPTVHC